MNIIQISFQSFSHVKKHHVAEVVFDASKPSFNNSDIERKDWICSEDSSTIKKEHKLHSMTPALRVMGFTIFGKVDADHGGDTATLRARTLFIVCLNIVTVHWCSVNQNGVATSSFGS